MSDAAAAPVPAAAPAVGTLYLKEKGGNVYIYEDARLGQRLVAFRDRLREKELSVRSVLYGPITDAQWKAFKTISGSEDEYLRGPPRPDPVDAEETVVVANMRLLAVPPPAPVGGGVAGGEAAGVTSAITKAVADLTTATQELVKHVSALPQQVVDRLAEVDEESVNSSPMSTIYEVHVRQKMRGLLLYHCGLDIALGVDKFQRQKLQGREWDFRAPVLVGGPPPGAAADADNFVIFPSKLAYSQPPACVARQVTPTKFGTAAAPPLAHYLAIMEFTTRPEWTKSYFRQPGLLHRLETRLHITYDRVRSMDASISKVTDVVAVVGVVAPSPYTESVRSMMEMEPSPFPLLKEMMDAGRFVFIRVPLPASSSPRGAGSARGGASTTSAPKAPPTTAASGSP